MSKYMFLIVFIFFSNSLFSQDSIPIRKTTIKAYPFQILFNREYALSYERRINKRYSLEIIGSYYAAEWQEDSNELLTYYLLYPSNGFAVKLGLKRFSKKYSAPFGWYYSPLFMYKYIETNNIEQSNDEDRTWNFNERKYVYAFEFLLGYQKYIPDSRFSLGGYCGIGWRKKIIFGKDNYIIKLSHYDSKYGGMTPEETIYYNEAEYILAEYEILSLHLGFNIGFSF